MKSRVIIIDDEPLALEIIETYLNRLSDFEIVKKCSGAVEAFSVIKNQKIDLIFLDIEMPQLSGINFLKSLTDPPAVIITTAYRKYAVEGFDLNVLDYLLKPIPFERFLKAIDKYYKTVKDKIIEPAEEEEQKDYLYLKENKKLIKISYDDIFYIEGMKDYAVFHLANGRLISKYTLQSLEEILPESKFVRIHKSYIVSIPKVTAVTGSSVEIGKKELVIGRTFKERVNRALQIGA